jgi:hypothetical protein
LDLHEELIEESNKILKKDKDDKKKYLEEKFAKLNSVELNKKRNRGDISKNK